MSVTLKFYIFTGDKRRINKLNYLTEETTITGDFTNTVCITNNTILIDLDKFYEIAEWDIKSYNYLYIQDFNKYYFIKNVYLINTKVAQITTIEDPLYSNWTKLRYLTFYIARNENEYNEYIKDELTPFSYDKTVEEFDADTGSYTNTTFTTNYADLGRNTVISIISKWVGAGLSTVTPPVNTLPTIDEDFNEGSTCLIEAISSSAPSTINHYIYDDNTLESFIKSIVSYPFNIPCHFDSTVPYVQLGDTVLNDTVKGVVVGWLLDYIHSQYLVVADFTLTASSFLDYEPYTVYQIWIPFLSWVTLNADDILNKRIIVYYTVQYETGKAQVYIYDTTDAKMLYTNSCQLGFKHALNTTNNRQVIDQTNSNNIGLGVGLATSAIAIAGGVATGGTSAVLAVAGGIMNAGSQVANFIQKENTNYFKATGNLTNDLASIYTPLKVRIRKTSYKPYNYNSNFFHLYGRPLNAFRQLDTLTGITKLNNVRLDTLSLQDDEESLLRRALDDYIIL